MKPFYLYKRGGGIYYAEYNDPITHRRCGIRSLETTDKDEALAKAWALLGNIPKKQTKPSDVMNFINLMGQKDYKLEEMAMLQAMITGMRLGEIQAHRRCDIGDDMLYIRRAWSPVDGLKCPKNGKGKDSFSLRAISSNG